MAIDLTSKSIVPFGDRANKKQMILLIPAEASPDKPGILVLGNVDGSGTVGNGGCIWFDNTGAPHADVTIPTDEDAAGSLVMLDTGAANVLTFTKGTSTINLAAGADITLAAGGQLNIGAAAALTVSGAATVDQDLSASGTPTWTSIVTCSAGVKTKVAVTDIVAAPTQAEMVTALGTAAAAGAGFIGIIDDAAAGVNEYVCISNGTNWYYLAVATKGV